MSNSLNRVMKPSVLMEVTDTEGNIRTFEMTKQQFHKLRYSTARLFKELDNVEKTPILAIDRVKPQ
jgi:CRISPR/Cas system-associated protein endoribonuclease Cas2